MYKDPGSGLLFVQVLGAGLLTAAYCLRKRLAALFGRAAKAGKRRN